ncbi:MAG: helix-turn-helix transcriptional regulator [Bdellovibrionales bacterium]|nr:helix-turn-helix transcriptional regulator [Bdellovibrionales bacterium]
MSIKYSLKNLEKDYGSLTLADLLVIYREDNELTQTQMAHKLSTSKQKLCDFEKGRRLPSVKMVAKWAKKLKHPQKVWVQIVLQDQLRRDNVKLKVSIAS